jgi:hypothetical protein
MTPVMHASSASFEPFSGRQSQGTISKKTKQNELF